jgi:long-chain alkane monooxygenase
VTSAEDKSAQNFGLEAMPEHDARYDMCDEYLDLVKQLWVSWEPDAVVMDRETGTYTGSCWPSTPRAR